MFDLIIILYGLIIGSFLNVLIYRLPLEQSFFSPMRSTCPSCEKQIKWYENIPVISYVFLRAKCSFCKTKISIQYPIIELLSGFILLFLVDCFKVLGLLVG